MGSGTISGTNPNSGMISGIVGNNYFTGTISNVYNIETINGSRQTDICGSNIKGGTIVNAYALGTVENVEKGVLTAAQMTGMTALRK